MKGGHEYQSTILAIYTIYILTATTTQYLLTFFVIAESSSVVRLQSAHIWFLRNEKTTTGYS